jgi:hypothetical protein
MMEELRAIMNPPSWQPLADFNRALPANPQGQMSVSHDLPYRFKQPQRSGNSVLDGSDSSSTIDSTNVVYASAQRARRLTNDGIMPLLIIPVRDD